jgi:hypothetical protein
LIDELVNEIIPLSIRGNAGPNSIVCLGSCMKFSDYPDFWISQAGQDVKLLPHHAGEERMWLAVVQFKSCQGVPR